MKRIQFRILLSLLLVFQASCCFGQNAVALMRKASSIASASSGLSARFAVSGAAHISGTIKASGNKFHIASNGNSIWYNGRVMSTYNPRQNETTIFKPSAEELAEANPLLYVSGWEKNFSVKMASKQPANAHCLILTPKNSLLGVKMATVTMTRSCVPTKVVVRTSGGQTISVKISNLKRGVRFPAYTFEYPKAKYPKAKINHL